jgi:hypothetical protein
LRPVELVLPNYFNGLTVEIPDVSSKAYSGSPLLLDPTTGKIIDEEGNPCYTIFKDNSTDGTDGSGDNNNLVDADGNLIPDKKIDPLTNKILDIFDKPVR